MDRFIRDEEGRILATEKDQRRPEYADRPAGPWDNNRDEKEMKMAKQTETPVTEKIYLLVEIEVLKDSEAKPTIEMLREGINDYVAGPDKDEFDIHECRVFHCEGTLFHGRVGRDIHQDTEMLDVEGIESVTFGCEVRK